ncbi:protein BatD [Starkeya sp. ORNL1]|uniref:BatD family protein n=1 Tax=Starkeya sp. ORNL1 TaxID=2709380 RepID=UPI00146458C8|nr:BatD family protein [Starkeya sp. ORNL1]QJP13079.1 protein BatD [Starkeya sp. ORNL1]
MRWPLAFLLLGLAGPLAAQEAVVVRTKADPAAGAVIGQHVALYVDVLFHNAMRRPPRVAVPDVAGVQAFRFETQGTTVRDTIGGEPYVGQRFEFALYPRRGGEFAIPPATVTLLDSAGETTGSTRGEPVEMSVTVPAGVDPSQPVVATRHLTLDEQWAPAPGGTFKAGDAIVRTVTRTAEDVPGLVLRDLPLGAPDGVRVYTDPPDSEDRMNRGAITGRRVDRITYVFERGGRFELPAVAQPWWNLGEGALKAAAGAGATISVAEEPASGVETAPPNRRLAYAALFAALCLVFWIGTRYAAHARARHAAAATPESRAFAALRDACRAGDARAVYRAYSAWCADLSPAARAKAREFVRPLEASLFGTAAVPWSASDANLLLDRLESLRATRASASPPSSLPPLNPLADAPT